MKIIQSSANLAGEANSIGRVLEILLQQVQASQWNAVENEREVRQELRENLQAEKDAYLELELVELPHHPEKIENRLLKQMSEVEEAEENIHQISQSLQPILDKLASMTSIPDSIDGLTPQQLENQAEYLEEQQLELVRRMRNLRRCYQLQRDQRQRAENSSSNIMIPRRSTANPPR